MLAVGCARGREMLSICCCVMPVIGVTICTAWSRPLRRWGTHVFFNSLSLQCRLILGGRKLVYVRIVVAAVFDCMTGRLGWVKIAALRIGATAKEGRGERESGGKKYSFSSRFPLPWFAPFPPLFWERSQSHQYIQSLFGNKWERFIEKKHSGTIILGLWSNSSGFPLHPVTHPST